MNTSTRTLPPSLASLRLELATPALPVPTPEALRAALGDLGPQPQRWVECAVADFSAVARGKRVSAADFVGLAGCRLPSVVLGLTLVSGEPPAVYGPLLPKSYDDMRLVPDLATLAPRPGRPGEATVICEPTGALATAAGEVDASAYAPRAALRRVLAALAAQGLQATVAPELEFFLLARNAHGQPQAATPHASAPMREQVCDVASLERLSHFEPFFDELYAGCEVLGIPVNGHAHEAALSQYEVNFRPGEPLAQADAVWRFKRLAREVAARHGFLASFAPKPFLNEPGTGMHWHVSLQHAPAQSWPHVFATPTGADTPALLHFIAGLQAHAAGMMAVLAPHDMSWERIRLSNASPSHATWGRESRSVAFRIPEGRASSRRVENRLPGGDANPYLLLATTLGAGLAGLQAALPPEAQPQSERVRLPTQLTQALDALDASAPLRAVLGDGLVNLYLAVKRHEQAERAALADPRAQWDLTHLLELA